VAAGLPGTGVGGLFFILSAFFMVVAETKRTIQRRSSLARWRMVARHAGVAAAMVAAVTAVVWLLHHWLYPEPARGRGEQGTPSAGVTGQLVPFSPVLITLAALVCVLVVAYVARFLFRPEPAAGLPAGSLDAGETSPAPGEGPRRAEPSAALPRERRSGAAAVERE